MLAKFNTKTGRIAVPVTSIHLVLEQAGEEADLTSQKDAVIDGVETKTFIALDFLGENGYEVVEDFDHCCKIIEEAAISNQVDALFKGDSNAA